MNQLPQEPRSGVPVSAEWGTQVVRFLRYIRDRQPPRREEPRAAGGGGASASTDEFSVSVSGTTSTTTTFLVASGSCLGAFLSVPFSDDILAPSQLKYLTETSSASRSVTLNKTTPSNSATIYGWFKYPPTSTPSSIAIGTEPPEGTPWQLFYMPPQVVRDSSGYVTGVSGGFVNKAQSGAGGGAADAGGNQPVIPTGSTSISATNLKGPFSYSVAQGVEYRFYYAQVAWTPPGGVPETHWRTVSAEYYATTGILANDFYYTYNPGGNPALVFEAYKRTNVYHSSSAPPEGAPPAPIGTDLDSNGQTVAVAEQQGTKTRDQARVESGSYTEVSSTNIFLSPRSAGGRIKIPAALDTATADALATAVATAFGGAGSVPPEVQNFLDAIKQSAGSKASAAGTFVFPIATVSSDGAILQHFKGPRAEIFAPQIFMRLS